MKTYKVKYYCGSYKEKIVDEIELAELRKTDADILSVKEEK